MRNPITITVKDIEDDLWTIFDKQYPKLTAQAARPERQVRFIEEMSRYMYDLFLDYKSELRRMSGDKNETV